MHIGIDFGTIHTSAAIYDGRDLTFIPLDHKNTPHLLRSMILCESSARASSRSRGCGDFPGRRY